MLRRPDNKHLKARRGSGKRTVRTLLSPEQMNQALARESLRVDRTKAGPLALVLFRLPQTRQHRLAGVRLAKTILRRIRITDDVGWFDENHVGLLLPDTTQSGAWQLAQSVCETIAKRGTRPLFTLYVYAHQQPQANSKAAAPPAALTPVKVAS
jgi:hypothetical protein